MDYENLRRDVRSDLEIVPGLSALVFVISESLTMPLRVKWEYGTVCETVSHKMQLLIHVHKLRGCVAKPPLKLGHILIITSHRIVWIYLRNSYTCLSFSMKKAPVTTDCEIETLSYIRSHISTTSVNHFQNILKGSQCVKCVTVVNWKMFSGVWPIYIFAGW